MANKFDLIDLIRCTMLDESETDETDANRQNEDTTGNGPVTRLLNVNSPRMKIVPHQETH